MSKAYPSGAYRDPSGMVDSLRKAEKHLKSHTGISCEECTHSLGRIFDHDVCNIGKKRNKDGYCRSMDKR